MNRRSIFLSAILLALLFFWTRTLFIVLDVHPLLISLFMFFYYLLESGFGILFLFSLRAIIRNARSTQQFLALKKEQEVEAGQQEHLKELQKRAGITQANSIQALKELQSYLSDGDSETALHYLKEYSVNFENARLKSYSSDLLINAILYSKKDIAEAHNIQTDFQIMIPETRGFSDTVLSSLIFNLLDNGIDACIHSGAEHPYLRLIVRPKANFLRFYMENSKNPEHYFNHKTTKPDTDSNGYGLAIMEDIVKEYDGSSEWKDQGDRFESYLMLRLPETNDR